MCRHKLVRYFGLRGTIGGDGAEKKSAQRVVGLDGASSSRGGGGEAREPAQADASAVPATGERKKSGSAGGRGVKQLRRPRCPRLRALSDAGPHRQAACVDVVYWTQTPQRAADFRLGFGNTQRSEEDGSMQRPCLVPKKNSEFGSIVFSFVCDKCYSIIN